MSDSKKNGSSGDSPSEASAPSAGSSAPETEMAATGTEEVQIPREMFEQMLGALGAVHTKFIEGRDPEELTKLVVSTLIDTAKLEQFLVIRKPTWGFILKKSSNLLLKQVGRENQDFELKIFAPRDAYSAQDRDSVLNFIATLAIVTSPVARAVAKLMGVEITFFHMDKPLPGHKKTGLIVPGG